MTVGVVRRKSRPRLVDMLQSKAGIDVGTGMLDQATISRLLNSEVSRSRRYHNPLSIAQFAIGEALARNPQVLLGAMAAVARTLREHLRWTDSV